MPGDPRNTVRNQRMAPLVESNKRGKKKLSKMIGHAQSLSLQNTTFAHMSKSEIRKSLAAFNSFCMDSPAAPGRKKRRPHAHAGPSSAQTRYNTFGKQTRRQQHRHSRSARRLDRPQTAGEVSPWGRSANKQRKGHGRRPQSAQPHCRDAADAASTSSGTLTRKLSSSHIVFDDAASPQHGQHALRKHFRGDNEVAPTTPLPQTDSEAASSMFSNRMDVSVTVNTTSHTQSAARPQSAHPRLRTHSSASSAASSASELSPERQLDFDAYANKEDDNIKRVLLGTQGASEGPKPNLRKVLMNSDQVESRRRFEELKRIRHRARYGGQKNSLPRRGFSGKPMSLARQYRMGIRGTRNSQLKMHMSPMKRSIHTSASVAQEHRRKRREEANSHFGATLASKTGTSVLRKKRRPKSAGPLR